MTLKNGDFVRIDFTGHTEDGEVFDTTVETVAEEHDLTGRDVAFEPIMICVGKGYVLPGIDKALVGKKPGDEFSLTLAPEEGFGKKRSDMIKLMPIKAFKKQQVKPIPGLSLNIDGMHGTVKSVSGNRVIVDFNNPLSGQTLQYDVAVHDIVKELKDQAKALVSRMLRFAPETTEKEGIVTFTLPVELPEDLQKQVKQEVLEATTAKDVLFVVESPSSSEKA